LVTTANNGGLQYQAFRDIDQIVAEPLAKADAGGKKRMTRSHEPNARPPSCRRHNPQWPDDTAVDADPFEGGAQCPELDRLV
jgi:hypothetical protein